MPHHVRSHHLAQNAWLLFEDWGSPFRAHRVFFLDTITEQTTRIPNSLATDLLAAQLVYRNG